MTKDVLLEIGLEEVPAKYVRSSSEQLKERVEQFLTENRLAFKEVVAYATPRRLAVIVKEVVEKQEDIEEVAKGPAKKIALDEQGQWTKAAIGFVNGQGLSTDDIFFEDIKGVEYVHVKKSIKGQDTLSILPGLKDVILKMTFPISMTWGNYTLKYIRPIHWLIALYGDTIIPFDILGVETGTTTRGHRFLGQETTVLTPSNYVSQLEKEYVLVNQEDRKSLIVSQIDALAQENDWVVELDEELLEEVTSIVEYPTAFFGTFDKKYLVVPDEVLITTMKEHQRYFYVKNKEGQLLPFFISVRNGNEQHLDNVVKGNEKVLVARLEDALFFTKEDAKIQIAQAVEKLKHVNFHVKIGSVYDKMSNTRAILTILSNLLQVDVTHAVRAGEIYKFDLVTNMVGEFPELQGIMGEKYALDKGESIEVAQAIREHYLPLSSDGALPESISGALLAVADKLDTLISFFLKGMIPSGSNDPYALRRQAIGIVSIFEKENWQIDMVSLFETILKTVYHVENSDVVELLRQFILARLQQKLQSYDIRYDVIESVLASQTLNIPLLIHNAKDLQEHTQEIDFKVTIEAVSRVLNLAKKSHDIENFGEINIVSDLFETDSEKVLAQVVQQVEHVSYDTLKILTQPITAFFNDNMVLVENEEVRNNRLSILVQCATKVLNYVDTTKLVVK
ncbi:glycine--tRNA ligase subunit beta [Carnobacteriaceae bacterium zg-ZUI78]|nr:glycine--tRNA ligase subunit beta [Carnobacteriaceae bacterium zg-ZUI78]